jgi:hypothetical protein
MSVLAELKNRGVADVFFVVCYAEVVVMPMWAWDARAARVSGLGLSA